MVNQDPQPDIFETTMAFANGASPVGTSVTNTIFTHQGHNEEVRIYALSVQVLNNTTKVDISATAEIDFQITLIAGPNEVPSKPFDASWIIRSGEGVMALTCPVLVKFKQPLRVRVEAMEAVVGGTDIEVKIQLIGETGVIKV
jgi:hypothetical protein|tara:strand:+ start:1674 stop:2102 length:429 start_codon:yes stop_codon:yes gene_type:complete